MATAAPTDAAPPAKKGKMKLIIILVVVVLLLGAAAVGGLLLLKKKQSGDDPYAEEADQARPPPAAAAARDPKVKPVFVALDLFTVNLADRETDRYLQVQMSLELRDEKSGEMVKNYMPIIRNNILTALSYKTSAQLLERHGKQRLSRELRTEVARALDLEPPDIDEEELPPAEGATAAPEKKDDRKRRRRLRPEDYSPVVGVHFSNFIIQ